jgi:FkbM family methyltransferase
MKALLVKIASPIILFKRASSNVIEVFKKYFISKFGNKYNFSFNDAVLHLRERNWKLKPVEILSQDGKNYHLSIDGLKFYWPKSFSTDDLSWIYAEIFNDTKINPSSYQNENAPIDKNSWIFDAGAGEGFFTAYALGRTSGPVFAFEPILELKTALIETFKNDYERGRFKMISAGLGKEERTMQLSLNFCHPCDASISNDVNFENRQIEIVTIDEIVASEALSGPGFIKMDIEGAEMDALKGATVTLKNLKPNLAIAVYHEYENGFECAEIIKKANPNYTIEFRGMNGYFKGKTRPYILFAY